jgi:hypothetical protein
MSEDSTNPDDLTGGSTGTGEPDTPSDPPTGGGGTSGGGSVAPTDGEVALTDSDPPTGGGGTSGGGS